LLGYYTSRRVPDWQDNAGRHLLWFIMHEPASPALVNVTAIRPLSPALQQQIDRAWADDPMSSIRSIPFGGWQVPFLMPDGFHFPWGGVLLVPNFRL